MELVSSPSYQGMIGFSYSIQIFAGEVASTNLATKKITPILIRFVTRFQRGGHHPSPNVNHGILFCVFGTKSYRELFNENE